MPEHFSPAAAGPRLWRSEDASADESSFKPVQTSELDFFLDLQNLRDRGQRCVHDSQRHRPPETD